jgi:hypothetical protein
MGAGHENNYWAFFLNQHYRVSLGNRSSPRPRDERRRYRDDAGRRRGLPDQATSAQLIRMSADKFMWRRGMKILSSLFFLISLVGSAWAGAGPPLPPVAPGPEMSAGIIGMTLAAGVVYLIKRRQRS